MITIENTKIYGWEEAVRGMRNPMNSWSKSDSNGESIGENDYELMLRLAKNGPVHAKYRRMITVYADITAPLYFWKEFDTYKVGTVANSCSTMHKITDKEFTLDDISHEHLGTSSLELMETIIDKMNFYRDWYINYNPADLGIYGCPSKKDIWWEIIQMLPSSYNQKRTVMMNYEVLSNIYKYRKDHKLDEWRYFCNEWITSLPYSEIITCET